MVAAPVAALAAVRVVIVMCSGVLVQCCFLCSPDCGVLLARYPIM